MAMTFAHGDLDRRRGGRRDPGGGVDNLRAQSRMRTATYHEPPRRLFAGPHRLA